MDQSLPKSNTLPDQAAEQAQADASVDQHLRHLEDLQDEPDQDQDQDQQPQKNPSKSKPTKSKPAAFVTKLFGMLEEPANDDVSELIKWSSDGTMFSVVEPVKFASKVLPHYFKHNNWNSFIRQLNMYQFQKVNSRTFENTADVVLQPEWEFKHPSFLKGNQRKLKEIVRRAGANSKSGQEAHQEKVEDISRNAKIYASNNTNAEASSSRNMIDDDVALPGNGIGSVRDGLKEIGGEANGNENGNDTLINQESTPSISNDFYRLFEKLERHVRSNQAIIEGLQNQFQTSTLQTSRALENLSLVLKDVVSPSQNINPNLVASYSSTQSLALQRLSEAQTIVSQLQEISGSNLNFDPTLANDLHQYDESNMDSEALRSAMAIMNQSKSTQEASGSTSQSKGKGKKRADRSGTGATLNQLLGHDQPDESASRSQSQTQDDIQEEEEEEEQQVDAQQQSGPSQIAANNGPQAQVPQVTTPAVPVSRDPRKRTRNQVVANGSSAGRTSTTKENGNSNNPLRTQGGNGVGAGDGDGSGGLDQDVSNKRSRIE